MKFLSLARPFTNKAGSSSNTPPARKGQAADQATQSTVVESEDSQGHVISTRYAGDITHQSPAIPLNHASITHASTARHSRSTPPAMAHHPQQQQSQQHREHRKSLIRSSSRTSLKRALSPSTTASTRQQEVSERHNDPSDTFSKSPATSDNAAPSTQRRRRKSFKELFRLASSIKGSQATTGSVETPPSKSDTVNHGVSAHTRRRYSSASPSSSSSTPALPSSPASIRKSTSTSAFRQKRENSEMVIPPVPALPAHISLAPISPIIPSSASMKAPHTPISASSPSMRIPYSAQSTASSPIASTPGTTSSSTHISRSSSVPTLHASSASTTASPLSSTGTLATPQTIGLRSPPSSSHHTGTKQLRSQQGSDSKNTRTLESMPLLLGPCLSDTLLSSDTLHTAETLKTLHGQQQEIKSENGYGSEAGAIAGSAEGDEYGIASNISHGGNEKGVIGNTKSPEQAADRIQKVEVRMNDQSKSLTRANSGSLRVNTSLAHSAALTNKRTSTYLSGNDSSSSLSPYSQSFPTSPLYRTNDLQYSAPSASVSRRTSTSTPTAVPSPSPRALSHGAEICLCYTILRLRKDGRSSPSTQPEKVNILQWGGRRYPSSTRTLSRSSMYIASSHINDQNNQLDREQRRKEPKSANMQKELAWINIVKKLQSRKRLTLMEEGELDSFKKLQNNWTPCSSLLAFNFNIPSSSSTNVVNTNTNVNANANGSGAPPLVTPENTALRDHTTARKLSNDQPRGPVAGAGAAQPMLSKSASHVTAVTSPFTPPPAASTSALVSGAFLKAQQTTWTKWLSRRPFEMRMKFTLHDGESFCIIREMKGQLIVSDRIHAWASATLGDVEVPPSKSVVSISNDTFDSVKIAAVQNMASPRSAIPLPRDKAANVNSKFASIEKSTASSESIPFARNHIAIPPSRFPPYNEAVATTRNKPDFFSSSDNSLVAITTKSNSKPGFGHTLAAKFGFKSGKNKGSQSLSRDQDGDVPQAETTGKRQESSSASSFANTVTTKSTPSTSASSHSSDQLDTIITSKAENLAKPVRPERSARRPPRGERNRPTTMIRSASQGVPSAQEAQRMSMLLASYSGRANDWQPSMNRSDTSLPSRPRSMVPRSQTEQHIHSYHSRGVSLEASKRSSMIVDPASTPPVPQRRVRVLSQPEGGLAPRPHSMYTQPQSRLAHQDRPHHKPGPRPMSQLLQVPRPKSLVVPGVPGLQAGNSHSDPQVRTMSSSQAHRDVRQNTSSRRTDDDETPLAVLRQNSGTPPSVSPSSRQEAGTPEPRPRLRSAMRSTSQPRPISTVSSSNRNSTISFHEGHSRSASPASNRQSVYDPPSPRNGRESWIKGEDTLKSLIIEEQLKQENEAKDITRRRKQRKVWEDHRRRSVYLEDQAAAAEKAATEAQRRQSHLYMSMALAHPQPHAQHGQAMTWTNGSQNSSYGAMQQQSHYFPPQHLQTVRMPIMQRPISYHHDQIGNRNFPPIVYGQPVLAYQR